VLLDELDSLLDDEKLLELLDEDVLVLLEELDHDRLLELEEEELSAVKLYRSGTPFTSTQSPPVPPVVVALVMVLMSRCTYPSAE
jgi:hypothetical protein